ncbi:MAG: GNAT family N-acetyltransferase [Gammaproteobacteria bacterium]|nr:GNAT family N-acetyltransferase [Gammaproteobacteria bacterium]
MREPGSTVMAAPQPVIRETAGAAELAQARALRRRVFVDEQGIPAELDDDGHDDGSIHVLAWLDGAVIGTARLTPHADGSAHLSRVAVLPAHRGGGLGARLVRALEALGRRARVRSIYLFPHHYLEGFYAGLGYHVTAGGEVVGGHRLIRMEKQLGE